MLVYTYAWMVAYFMITNLVMLWYCSVSTESTSYLWLVLELSLQKKTDGGVYIQL